MPPSTTIVLASRNAKKLGELRDLLAPSGLNVVSVGDFPDVPEVVEDGTTFAENAAKKATQTARHLQQWALGEDSGLMVDALDGAPGIYSARYSGPDATDERNNQKLMEALSNVPTEKRGACYVCSIAVADPNGDVQLTVEQRCRGRVTEAPRGTNGFGYDPYFLIPEYHRTFGELSPVVKRQLSHRGRALRQLAPALSTLFS
ncbi:Non-canonical purine NTP pyrophosphatase [Maioricimonas rarisocia]|uniref:dITP/XTP pyrophosphatase n=1 Tax=Maioricimonas rarisocia TaxID=2528026 RepID=A0A517Z1W3_9PLAN|nr:Non-canonical purine NTP pyrophosphatase [Maioricimonas rarisocia]